MKNAKKLINDFISKYTYRVEWSEADQVYIAKALEIPSILAHANTQENAIREVKIPLLLALESMIEEGHAIPEPISLHSFKGNFLVRTSPEKHKELTLRAAESGVSVNQYVLSKLG
jgi:predicted RNase H-like HicB family nuclease